MEQQLNLNLQSETVLPCGFTQEAYYAAQKIIDFCNGEALSYIEMLQHNNLNNESKRTYLIEVRRACKYITACRDYWLNGYHWRLPVYD